MKTSTFTRVVTVFAMILSIVACQKNLNYDLSNGAGATASRNTVGANDTSVTISYPQQRVTGCPNAPDYGDSIIYIQSNAGSDYIVSPVNHPDTGTYYAWPKGMIIDKNTGAINVTKSEGGLRYNIGYIRKGTTDTCLQTLILAGASYEDSLYVLNNNQNNAAPYFDADPNNTSICDPSGGPGGNTCDFDVNGQAAFQHIIVDHKTGIIDLKNTAKLAFGLIPINGTTITTTMAYQLNDKSNLTPQKITLTFVYYNKVSDVPADLLSLVSAKLNKILNQILLINLPTGTSSSEARSGNPRPPIIIVTKSAQ